MGDGLDYWGGEPASIYYARRDEQIEKEKQVGEKIKKNLPIFKFSLFSDRTYANKDSLFGIETLY